MGRETISNLKVRMYVRDKFRTITTITTQKWVESGLGNYDVNFYIVTLGIFCGINEVDCN